MSFIITKYKNKILQNLYKNKELKPSVFKNLKILDEIDINCSINDASYAVIDTELTGLDSKTDCILSIGAVRMKGGSIYMGDYFYRIVDPSVCLRPDSVVIHGITPQEASECPSIDLILPEFIDFCKDKIIVGYCIAIDLEFINKEMKRLYGFNIQNPVIDLLKIYNIIKKRKIGYDAFVDETLAMPTSNLFEIAREFDVPIQEGHNALSDAFITAQVFQQCLPALARRGINTVKDLIRISKP
ncbi:MAG: 3'-5' exonuclease [Thermodesulfovibrionales bacterium]|nr:3'-5' exonuclease [Thermodesulfovibrionales bacterium]